MSDGVLVVIEGIDGAGKTSVSKEVVSRLTSLGFKAIYTYEPFTQFITDFINKHWDVIDPIMLTLLMAADRHYHISRAVLPYLKSGYIVVSDRYYYSSVAYQGAQGVDVKWIAEVNKFVIKPRLAIYLDVEPSEGLRRKKASTTRVREMESNVELIERAREIYLSLVLKGELVLVDAMQDIHNVVDEVVAHVLKAVEA